MSDIHTCSYYCDRPACIKAQRDGLRDRFQVMQAQAEIDAKAQRIAALQSGEPVNTKPIAAVKGWFHGECVVQALDPAAVLPAGMALYAAPQPVVPDGYVLLKSFELQKAIGRMEMIRGASQFCDCTSFEIANSWMNETHGGALLSAGKGGE